LTSGTHIRSGKLRGLAVTGLKRGAVFPELPTVAESGLPGFELTNSYSYHAPAGTARGIVRAMNAIIRDGMHAPQTLKVIAADGSEVAANHTPEEFKTKFDREYQDLEKLMTAAMITAK